MLRPAVVEKAGEAFEIEGLAEFAGFKEISELEDAAADIVSDLKDILSFVSDGFNGEKSEERARVERAGSRLNALESEVKLVINVLGIDTVSRLSDPEEK